MINKKNLNCQPLDSNNAPWLNSRIVMFPIYFFQIYLAISVFIFAFGPWPWPVPDPILLYLFLFSVQVALWFGYKTGVRSYKSSYVGSWNINSLIKISLVLNLIWIIPTFMLRMGMQDTNFANIISSVFTGFLDPGAMYGAKIEALSTVEKTSFLGYVTQLISPILWLLIPLAIVYWDRMSHKSKLFFVFFVVADLLSWIATGTNKGIADFALLFPWLLVAGRPEIITKTSISKIIKILSIILVGLVIMVTFFVSGQKSRGGGEIPTYDYSAKISIDKNNWMVFSLPPDAQGAVAALTSYFVQGYYALFLSLPEPFTTSYGVGNSYYLTGIVQSFVGQGVISNRTYPAKIEKYGWDRFRKWHSFYTWIASDVSFPGTIVVVFLIGRLFAKVWLDVLHKENPFAVALFALLIIMLFYLPANNQVLAFSRTAMAFWVILVCWVFTRKRYVW